MLPEVFPQIVLQGYIFWVIFHSSQAKTHNSYAVLSIRTQLTSKSGYFLKEDLYSCADRQLRDHEMTDVLLTCIKVAMKIFEIMQLFTIKVISFPHSHPIMYFKWTMWKGNTYWHGSSFPVMWNRDFMVEWEKWESGDFYVNVSQVFLWCITCWKFVYALLFSACQR